MVYEIEDFMALIRKAKLTRNLRLLEETHMALLEWMGHLQECDRMNSNKWNFAIKKKIEKLESLNYIIFHLFSRFTPPKKKEDRISKEKSIF